MMRISKFVLCCVAQLALLLVAGMGYAQSAEYVDPCTPARPLGSATGCGALITVTLVDGNGNAVAFTVTIPNNGNGNPYDGTEDTLVGIVNSSGGVLNSITLSATDTTFGGIFNFDQDGPCGYKGSNTKIASTVPRRGSTPAIIRVRTTHLPFPRELLARSLRLATPAERSISSVQSRRGEAPGLPWRVCRSPSPK